MWGIWAAASTKDSCWLCQVHGRVNNADLCEECTAILRAEDRVVPEPHSHRTDREKVIDE